MLAKVGVLTQEMLRAGRKYAVVVILVTAAFLTPPDPWSQMLMAIPLAGLFELSIWLTGVVERQRLKEIARDEAEEAAARAAEDEGPLPANRPKLAAHPSWGP